MRPRAFAYKAPCSRGGYGHWQKRRSFPYKPAPRRPWRARRNARNANPPAHHQSRDIAPWATRQRGFQAPCHAVGTARTSARGPPARHIARQTSPRFHAAKPDHAGAGFRGKSAASGSAANRRIAAAAGQDNVQPPRTTPANCAPPIADAALQPDVQPDNAQRPISYRVLSADILPAQSHYQTPAANRSRSRNAPSPPHRPSAPRFHDTTDRKSHAGTASRPPSRANAPHSTSDHARQGGPQRSCGRFPPFLP